MSQLKQRFKQLLLEIKKSNRDSYTDIAHKTGIKLEVLKNAGSPSNRSFSVTQEDYNALKNAYTETPNLVAVPKGTLGVLEDLTQQLDEARKAIKKEADRIKSETQSIIDPTIKFIANKYDMSEEQIKNIFEKMLIEYLEKETKTNK